MEKSFGTKNEPFSCFPTYKNVNPFGTPIQNPPAPETDEALMRRVQQNDTKAFALLCARYRPGLRAFFVSLLPTGSQNAADDMAQETLLRLWLARHKWEPTGNFAPYLFQIGRHYFFNQREKVRRRAACEISVDALVSGENPESGLVLRGAAKAQPEAVLMERWEAARVQYAVNQLPPRLRAVFVLSHDGVSQKEIACRLQIPVGTVKSRLFDAVRRLRACLSDETENTDKAKE